MGTEAVTGSILVVDDDPDLLEIMTLLLESMGIVCLPARSLDDVKALGDRVQGCNLALLDVNLGAGSPSGIEVRDWLRAHQFTGRTVFLTGHAQDHPSLGQALAPGDAVLSKPVETDVLLRLARQVP